MQFLENIYIKFNQSSNETSNGKQACSLIHNRTHYSVLIDGIKYPTQVPLHKNVSINFECLDQISSKKIILFYNTWFGNDVFSIGVGYRTPFSMIGCPVTNCETTNDKNRLNESDFVITHMRDSISKLPKFRPPNQRWIFILYVMRIFHNQLYLVSLVREFIAKNFIFILK